MMRYTLPLLALALLLGPCSAADYYFESLTYNIESNPRGTSYSCSLQFVSLRPDLRSIEITVPYGSTEIRSEPMVFLGKKQAYPIISETDGRLHLDIDFDAMKVGELETLNLQYSVDRGTELSAGARVEVRTFGLGGNVTAHAMNLKLPRGFTISKIETPDGVLRSGKSGIPLDLGREPLVLYFVLRRKTILDNRYVSQALFFGVIGGAAAGVIYLLYRKKIIFTGSKNQDTGEDGSEPRSQVGRPD